jgi:sialate O-acetylesterase
VPSNSPAIKHPLSIISFTIGWLLLFALFSPEAHATVKLPAIISDNMALQAAAKVVIWGQASAGEKVVVRFNHQEVTSIADPSGNWKVELRDLKPGGPYELIVKGTNTITVKNVVVGEVWLCAGQSNMAMSLLQSKNGTEESARATQPNIRLFKIEHQTSSVPMSNVKGKWEVCTPATAAKFSAVAYFFGRALYNDLSRPIGLIESAWGGTPAELWISKSALAKQTNGEAVLGRWFKEVKRYQERIPAWYQAKCMKRHLPITSVVPSNIVSASMDEYNSLREPSCLFNGMIAPVALFSIAGVLWYQGESNVDRAAEYRYLLPLLIADWRAHWGTAFPFLFVQLPNYAKVKSSLPANAWAEVREAQLQTLAVPNTAMVVSIDLGDPLDIHPKSKVEIGNRLALSALATVYKKNIEYSGPLFSSIFIKNGTAVLSFTHTAGSLKTSSGSEPRAFTMAGPDHRFLLAKAKIFQDKVFVVSPLVPNPVAVRYGWANNPECNLVNAVNLPASPFRTDQWPN